MLTGRKEAVPEGVRALVADDGASHDVMYAINEVLIPRLTGGRALREGHVLPATADGFREARQGGFNVLRGFPQVAVGVEGHHCACYRKGDIHDIGKNIVRMLLRNTATT